MLRKGGEEVKVKYAKIQEIKENDKKKFGGKLIGTVGESFNKGVP